MQQVVTRVYTPASSPSPSSSSAEQRKRPRKSTYPRPDFIATATGKDDPGGDGDNEDLDNQPRGHSLSHDLGKAFDREADADITVECLSSSLSFKKKVFRANRFLLSARSDVFAAMFARDSFAEGASRTLVIEDMTPDALREFLRFFYTDNVRDVKTHCVELLKAAEKYNVPRLKTLCEQALCEDLDDDRVIDVAVFSHAHRADKALAFAVEAIASNFAAVMERPGWKELLTPEQEDLLAMVHRKVAGRMELLEKQAAKAALPRVLW